MGRNLEANMTTTPSSELIQPFDMTRLSQLTEVGKGFSYGLPRYSLGMLLDRFDLIAQDAAGIPLREVRVTVNPKYPNSPKRIIRLPEDNESSEILKKHGVPMSEEGERAEVTTAARAIAETQKGLEGRTNITLGFLWKTVMDFSTDDDLFANKEYYKLEFIDAANGLKKYHVRGQYIPSNSRHLLYREIQKNPGQAFDHLVNHSSSLPTS